MVNRVMHAQAERIGYCGPVVIGGQLLLWPDYKRDDASRVPPRISCETGIGGYGDGLLGRRRVLIAKARTRCELVYLQCRGAPYVPSATKARE